MIWAMYHSSSGISELAGAFLRWSSEAAEISIQLKCFGDR